MILGNSRHLLPTIYICAFLLVFLPLSALSVLGHGDETHTLTESSSQQKDIQKCLSLSEVSNGEDACYFALCERQSHYLCAEDIMDAVVLLGGPEKALSVLDSIMESPLFAIQTDGHQLAHKVGNATLHHFGLSGEAFLRCTIDFNYGCQHGFFEDALVRHSEPVQAATEICETIPERPYKNKFYCYHGVGHGFMFHESYNLMNSLDLCDQLPSYITQEACWQGVFMENVNGFFQQEEGDMGFVDNDPLAPCNRVENKYRHQCYENHAKYVLFHHNNSMKDASRACLDAGDHISSCLTSLGLMVTNPGWQQTLRGSFNGTFIETAAHLCEQFPIDYTNNCRSAAVANLFNFDNTDIRRAIDFCLFFEDNRNRCFKTIGSLLVSVAVNDDEMLKACNTTPEEYRDNCYQGASEYQNQSSESDNANTQNDSSSSIFYVLFQKIQTALYELLMVAFNEKPVLSSF